MTNRARDWANRRRRAAERRPSIRVDRCVVEAVTEAKRARYRVTIEGFNLHPAISPPRITVGGQVLHDVVFAEDGRQLRGVLDDAPVGDRVEVDYGFARAEERMTER